MIQEEKDLLLKDLCARLPYGVKVEYNSCACEVLSIDRFHEELTIRVCPGYCPDVKLEDVKPFLFPLSSMTEEQKQELYNLVEETAFQIIHSEDGSPQPHIAMDWYNKNHFDYRGLIEEGLVLNATGLNIY